MRGSALPDIEVYTGSPIVPIGAVLWGETIFSNWLEVLDLNITFMWSKSWNCVNYGVWREKNKVVRLEGTNWHMSKGG